MFAASRRFPPAPAWVPSLAPFLFLCLLLASLPSAADISDEERYPPAVRELNGQLTGAFDYGNLEETSSVLRAGPPFGDILFRTPESDSFQGTLGGTISVPIDRELAARVFLTTFYQLREFDRGSDTESHGASLGGDVFLRYPRIFEVSIGPRYRFTDSEEGLAVGNLHSLGAEAIGRLFLDDFGAGPVDLEVALNFLDQDASRGGAGDAGRRYAADAGIVFYLADRVSVSAGGGWSRTNFDGGRNQRRAVGRGSIDLLIPGTPAVTLSLAGLGGELKRSNGIGRFSDPTDRVFYQVGFSINLSFPGADSLVELERYYY